MSRKIPKNPTAQQVDAEQAWAIAALRRVFAAWPAAVHQAQTMGPGYPSTSGAAGSSGNSSEGSSVERLALNALEGRSGPDPAKEAQGFLLALRLMLGNLETADHLTARVEPARRPGEADLDKGCRNRHTGFEPAYRGDRCSWCYGFHRDYGCDPSTDLLARHDSGQYVTVAMVEKALGVSKRAS